MKIMLSVVFVACLFIRKRMEIGIPELLIILVIVIVLFGPGRFGKILGELGSGLRAFKDNLSGEEKDDAPKPPAGDVNKPIE
jgi:sec-independent protein translocase protein TatA